MRLKQIVLVLVTLALLAGSAWAQSLNLPPGMWGKGHGAATFRVTVKGSSLTCENADAMARGTVKVRSHRGGRYQGRWTVQKTAKDDGKPQASMPIGSTTVHRGSQLDFELTHQAGQTIIFILYDAAHQAVFSEELVNAK